MRATLRLAFLLVTVVVASAPPGAHAAEPTLEGIYAAEGINPDGSEYRAVVKILRRGESFLVAWVFPDQVDEAIALVPRSAGVGVTSGGMLAVSYYGQDLTGVILYQIENGGERLLGRWVSANGEGAVHSETLTKMAMPATAPSTSTPPAPTPNKPARPVVPRNDVAKR